LAQVAQLRFVQLISQERDTLLKLVAAMSCEQYGYSPDAQRSAISSIIKDGLESVELGCA
jgi:hypothetical protein